MTVRTRFKRKSKSLIRRLRMGSGGGSFRDIGSGGQKSLYLLEVEWRRALPPRSQRGSAEACGRADLRPPRGHHEATPDTPPAHLHAIDLDAALGAACSAAQLTVLAAGGTGASKPRCTLAAPGSCFELLHTSFSPAAWLPSSSSICTCHPRCCLPSSSLAHCALRACAAVYRSLRRREPGSSPGRADAPHGWDQPLLVPLRRPQHRLACHAACSAAARHDASRPALPAAGSCMHVALTVLLSFICQVVRGHGGARHQRQIQEWPFAGVSLFCVLGRSCEVRVCCVCDPCATREVCFACHAFSCTQ